MTSASLTTPEVLSPASADTRPGFGSRLWNAMLAMGERRAASEVARMVRHRGMKPTGDIQRDIDLLGIRHPLR